MSDGKELFFSWDIFDFERLAFLKIIEEKHWFNEFQNESMYID